MHTHPETFADELRRALGASEVRETHSSFVFLTDTRAIKLKKPVRFGFLDLSTPDARRRSCESEVGVNQELARDVVLGVRSVIRNGTGLRLSDADDDRALDWVVEMRRFDEERTMAALLAKGDLTFNDAAAVGRRIAAFHRTALRVAIDDAAERALDGWRRNLFELGDVAGPEHADAVEAMRAFGDGFVRHHRDELERRAADGLIRDGHGDLRAEHVLLDRGVTIVDRLEFDATLRAVDVADDLAFLVMDLEALGVRWAADAVVGAYRAAGGDAGSGALLAFFATNRALIRAKVTLLRAQQLDGDPRCIRLRDHAAGLTRLGEHLAWRARPSALLAVCGPPASGKSHLARALAPRFRATLLSSDVVRKELLGIPAGRPAPGAAYDRQRREAVYAELGRRVRVLPERTPAIVDATFGSRSSRSTFAGALGESRRDDVRWVECQAPVETLVERAAARRPEGAHGSDAGPSVAARLALAFEPLDEVPDRRHLTVDGREPVEATVRRIGAWLDAGAAVASAQDVAHAAAR